MIINLFLMLLAVAVVLLYFGYQRNQMYMVIVAFAFMFLMGMNVIFDGLSYSIGANITIMNSSLTMIQNNYAVYTNHTLSFLFVFISAAGAIVTMMQLQGGQD